MIVDKWIPRGDSCSSLQRINWVHIPAEVRPNPLGDDQEFLVITLSPSPINSESKNIVRHGLTLVEAAMVLTILAIVVGGVMLWFSLTNDNRKSFTAINQLSAINDTISSTLAGQGNYNNLSSSLIIPNLPASMNVNGTTLLDPYGGTITVSPTGNNNSQYTVEFDGIPQTSCATLASTDVGRRATNLNVNGTNATPPWLPTTAQSACSSNGGNAVNMTWTFF